jgi:hypothetical protein
MLALTSRHRSDPRRGGRFFAVGSTLFAWFLLRGRMIPVRLVAFRRGGLGSTVASDAARWILRQRGELGVVDAWTWFPMLVKTR